MAFRKSYDELPVVDQPACIHLRSKSLYVSGQMDRGEAHEITNRHYWCNQTQHVTGPDTAAVARANCICGRPCYCSSY